MADYKLNIDIQQGLGGLNEIKKTLDDINRSIQELSGKINQAFTGDAPKRAAKGTAELNPVFEYLNMGIYPLYLT